MALVTAETASGRSTRPTSFASSTHSRLAEDALLPHPKCHQHLRLDEPGSSILADTGGSLDVRSRSSVTSGGALSLSRQQNPMEPHATIARWDGDR